MSGTTLRPISRLFREAMHRGSSAVGVTGVLYACTVQKSSRTDVEKGQRGEAAVHRNTGMAVPPREGRGLM